MAKDEPNYDGYEGCGNNVCSVNKDNLATCRNCSEEKDAKGHTILTCGCCLNDKKDNCVGQLYYNNASGTFKSKWNTSVTLDKCEGLDMPKVNNLNGSLNKAGCVRSAEKQETSIALLVVSIVLLIIVGGLVGVTAYSLYKWITGTNHYDLSAIRRDSIVEQS